MTGYCPITILCKIATYPPPRPPLKPTKNIQPLAAPTQYVLLFSHQKRSISNAQLLRLAPYKSCIIPFHHQAFPSLRSPTLHYCKFYYSQAEPFAFRNPTLTSFNSEILKHSKVTYHTVHPHSFHEQPLYITFP